MKTEAGAAERNYGYIPIAILCNILWGSAIPFINIGYRLFGIGAGESGSQILFAGCRFFLAGCITVLIRSLTLKRPALPQRKNLPSVLKLAAAQTVGQYVLFYIGVAHTASVKASIISGLGAFVSILIASYVFHYETMNRTKWIGGILGILGVIVMNWRPGGFGGGVTFAGEGALLLSMISCALSAGLIKRYSQTEDPVTLNGWQFIAGGAVMRSDPGDRAGEAEDGYSSCTVSGSAGSGLCLHRCDPVQAGGKACITGCFIDFPGKRMYDTTSVGCPPP